MIQAMTIAKETKTRQFKLSFQQLSEGFWFTASFLLFLLLGPFSAPIVAIAIFSLAKNHGSMTEPEPATQKIKSNH